MGIKKFPTPQNKKGKIVMKEKIILALFELEELIKIEKDKETRKYLKAQYTKLNNKLKKENC